jgi:hypothetical protein
MLGLALVLATTGTTLLIFGASQQAMCSPAGTGCTPANYTPGYAGISILAAAVTIAVASSPKPLPTKHEPTPIAVTE